MGAARDRHWNSIVATMAGAAYAALLLALAPPASVGPDDHGYFLQGTILAQRGTFSFALESPVQFVGDNWLAGDDGRFRSRYSPGIAGAVAAMQLADGVESSFQLNAVLAALGVAGVLCLVAELFGIGWGVTAVATLVLSPTFTGQALLGMSNIGAMSALVWGVVLLLRWRAHGGLWRAAFAGLALGIIPLIRLPEAIVAVPIAAFVIPHCMRVTRARRDVLVAMSVAAIPLAALSLYNLSQFGGLSRTAYGLSGEQSGFAPGHLAVNAKFYARHLIAGSLGLLPVAAMVGLAIAVSRREWRAWAWMFAGIIGSVGLLYGTYVFLPTPVPMSATRFLLPIYPFLIACAFVVPWYWTKDRSPRARWMVAGSIVLGQLLWLRAPLQESVRGITGARWMQHRIAGSVQRHLQDGDVLAASEEVASNLDIYQRWRLAARDVSLNDQTRPAAWKRLTLIEARRRPFEGMTVAERDSSFLAEVRRWGTGNAAYFLLPGEALARPSSTWFCASAFARVDSVRLGAGWKPGRRLPFRWVPLYHEQAPGTQWSPERCATPPSEPASTDYIFLLRLKPLSSQSVADRNARGIP